MPYITNNFIELDNVVLENLFYLVIDGKLNLIIRMQLLEQDRLEEKYYNLTSEEYIDEQIINKSFNEEV